MRILFAGNPKIGIPALEASSPLKTPGVELAGVLTNPDRPSRRGGKPEPSAVSAAASLLSETLRGQGYPPLVQLKPDALDRTALDMIAAIERPPDLLVSFAYGSLFSPEFLALFPLGGINIHPSLLPRYRGAAPIPAAILNRDKETGVTIQTLAPEMDAGAVLLQEKILLSGRETAASLSETAAQKAGVMLSQALGALLKDGKDGLRGSPQQGNVSYCPRISKAEGAITFSWSAEEIDARIRAFTPWPLSWTRHKDRRLFILEAAAVIETAETAEARRGPVPGAVLGADEARGILVQTGYGILGVTRLQYQAKKALDWRAFLNGAHGILHAVLG
jgi:methionyl-tRNA formyltransferase